MSKSLKKRISAGEPPAFTVFVIFDAGPGMLESRPSPSMQMEDEEGSGCSAVSPERAKVPISPSPVNESDAMDLEMEDSSENASKISSSYAQKYECVDFVGISNVSGSFRSGDIVTIKSISDDAAASEDLAESVELNFLEERDIYQLTYKADSAHDSSRYRNNILKIGSFLISSNGSRAIISELDAEWHRNQHWAKPTEHLGCRVHILPKHRVDKSKLLKLEMVDKEEICGKVWGWLPKNELHRKVSFEGEVWRVHPDTDGHPPVFLKYEELMESRVRDKMGDGELALNLNSRACILPRNRCAHHDACPHPSICPNGGVCSSVVLFGA